MRMLLLPVAVVSALTGVAAGVEPPAKVALTNARIIPVVGAEIARGTVLIEDGKIAAVGTDVALPYDAMEVDCEGQVVFPGLIDPESWRGLDVPNESLPVTPFLDVYDAINPAGVFFEESLRDGVTTVHVMPANNCVIGGLSRVVRPIGLSLAEMTVQPEVALKMSASPKAGFDRMRQMATLRETFLELKDYEERLAEQRYEESLKEKGEKIAVGPAEARKRGRDLVRDEHYDDAHRNLMRLKRGDFGAWIWCGAAMDVGPAVRFATEQGILERTVLVLGADAHKAIEEIKAAGRPVVLDAALLHRERDPITGALRETFVPAKLAEAGVAFSLKPNPGASLAERYLTYQAALCVRNGVPRQTALEAITINSAKALGLGDRLGSIEAGKAANLVVYSGDPLEFDSWVERVYIDGILAYERATDPRLAELLRIEKEQREAEEKERAAKQDAEKPADRPESKPEGGPEGKGDRAKPGEGGDEPAPKPKGDGEGSEPAPKPGTGGER